MPAIVIQAESLRSKLTDWGLDLNRCTPALPKPQYAILAGEEGAAWLRDVFRPDWMGLRNQLMADYDAGSENCSDFTRGCAWYAAIVHHRTSKRPAGTGFGFGEWWFLKDLGTGQTGGHGVCIIPWYNGTEIVPIFFDPQPGLQVDLSQSERNSCEFCRI